MSNLPAINPTALAKGLTKAASTIAKGAGDFLFMKLNKQGEWLFGADGIEAQDGSQWAVNPYSFVQGYIAWGDGEVLGEEMALMTGAPVVLGDLPDTAAEKGWTPQVGVVMVCLNGEDEGTQVMFKSNSKGGVKGIRALLDEVVTQIGVDQVDIVPVVELETDSYKHKKYGKIYNPVLSIQTWISMSGLPTAEEAEAPAPKAEAKQEIHEPDAEDAEIIEEPPAKKEPVKKRRRAIAT